MTPSDADIRTPGELLFESYLRSMRYGFEFEKPYPGKSKRPDYTIRFNDDALLFDVKDFEQSWPMGKGGYYDPYPPIREKINKARDKFREFKTFCCSVVLRNNGNPLVHVEDPLIMFAAMYGDSGYSFPVNIETGAAAGPIEKAFLGRGKMVLGSEVKNTTISALITLRRVAVGTMRLSNVWRDAKKMSLDEACAAARQRYPDFDLNETGLGVIVWENAVARIPLPRALFTGPFDERWAIEDERGPRVIFRGERLAELKGSAE